MSEKIYYKINNIDITLELIESKYLFTNEDGQKIDTDRQIISPDSHFNTREEANKAKEKEIKKHMEFLSEKIENLNKEQAKLACKKDRLYMELYKLTRGFNT